MPALFLQKLFLKISIFHNFLLTFIHIAYIIILVREIGKPKQKAGGIHDEIRNDDEALDDYD